MACTKLLALCLMMVSVRSIYAESDPSAESDAFYGYSGGAAVLRSYPAYRRPYYSPHAYRPAYGGYHAPARRYSYRFAPTPAPAPLPAPAPYYAEPAPVAVAAPLKAVPAVPVQHVETYAEPAPYVAPAPVATPAPAPYHASTAVVKAVPAVATSSQYHAQDEFGNVSYGYKNPNSQKDEKRDSYGNVVGAYSYIDATGVPKQLSYVADDFGFRVTGSHGLGVAPTPPH